MEDKKGVNSKDEAALEDKEAGSSKGKGSAKKRKVYQMDPRSPLKRQRIKIERFQSPMMEEQSIKPKMIKEEIIVLYKKGTFIAVRGAEESFYLCRTLQNVQNTTKRFRIQWLSLDQKPNIYKLDYIDQTEFACVLTNVKMDRIAKDTYRLPQPEQVQAQKVLERAIKVENGLPIDDVEIVEAEAASVGEDNDEWEDVQTPAKKRKQATSNGKNKNDVGNAKKTDMKTKVQKQKEKKKNLKIKEKTKKKIEKKEKKRGPDRNLKPNPKIKVLERDPFFESKEKIPFISIPIQSRLVIRAAFLDNVSMLKEQLKDENVFKVSYPRSVGNELTALHYALKHGNKDMINILVEECWKTTDRRKTNLPPVSLLNSIDTGTYNPVNLGVRNIKKLSVSRGSQQGNAAFSEDETFNSDADIDNFFLPLMKYGCEWDVVENFMIAAQAFTHYNKEEVLGLLIDDIHTAVSFGSRKLAARLVQEADKRGGFGFNFLHKEVLSFDKEDLRQNVMAISVRKKPLENYGITPVHCAAINPNIKYLSRLLSIEPDINVMDQKSRRPIHYAAACEGTGPLEFLLNKGASPFEISKAGNTALHCACIAGRSANVELLLKKGKALEASLDQDGLTNKWGVAGIDRGTRNSFTPLHLAISNYHTEVVRVLIKHGVNLNKQLSAGKYKLSPLMNASATGQLDIVRLLVQAGATVELLDKHKRTALTHAIKNGNTHVATYLLYLGADHNRSDSSGNTLVHYAAAYGWYFCLKLLVTDCGAEATMSNHWKITPLSIALFKGHLGIVDFLLSETDADINFTNDDGVTLVSMAANSQLVNGLLPQIEYLVERKGADPTIPNIVGHNALHVLVCNNVKHDLNGDRSHKPCDETMALSVEIAQIFVKAGCDPSQKDNDGRTPILLAVKQGNNMVVKYLVEVGGTISTDTNSNGCNVLHQMAELCTSSDMSSVLLLLAKKKSEENMDESGEKSNTDMTVMLNKMVHVANNSGYTPLLVACNTFLNTFNSTHSNHEKYRQQYENAVSFVKALIDNLGADINQTVQLINGDKGLYYGPDGKYSVVQKLVRNSTCTGESFLFSFLKLFLEYKPDLELGDSSDVTPLANSVHNNLSDVVSLLLEKGAKANVTFKYVQDTTSLILAAMNGNSKIMETLIKYGADTKSRHSSGQTALHYIVKSRSDEMKAVKLASMLLSHGADVNAICNKKRSALHLAVSANNGTANSSTDLEELLLEKGVNLFLKDIRGRSALHYVFVKNQRHTDGSALDPIDLCSLLTASMEQKQLDVADIFEQTPLHRAAVRGATICCMHLIQRNCNLHSKDSIGNTPLSLAVLNGHDSCAILLIQLGADSKEKIVFHAPPPLPVRIEPKKKILQWRPVQQIKKHIEVTQTSCSVFQVAIRDEQQGVAFMLLEKIGIGRSALEDAIIVGKYNVILRLMKRITDAKHVRGTNNKEQNLFHTLMIKSTPGSDVTLLLKVGQRLLDLGVSINHPDEYGCTPIFYAALYHHPQSVVQFFIDKNAQFDINWKDKFGRNVVAAFLWNYALVDKDWTISQSWLEMMIKHGATLDFHFDRPLPDPLAIGWVLHGNEHDYFTVKSNLGISPLIYALHNFHSTMVKFLLTSGASPNLPDTNGVTPLMHAVKLNEQHLVSVLLNNSWVPESIQGDVPANKLKIEKKLSRTVFNINVPFTLHQEDNGPVAKVVNTPKVAENEEELPEDDEELLEAGEELLQDNEEMPEPDDKDGGEIADDDEDSDTDTDIAKSEESEPTINRLGSKKISLMQKLSSNKELKTVEKTSDVDMTAVDSLGWNVIHHTVASLDYGTFDNDEVIYVLAKAGASFTQKDKAGLSPLDHALIRGAPNSAAMIQKLMDIPEDKYEKPTRVTFEVKDGFPTDVKVVNFSEDADKLLQEATSRVMDTSEDQEVTVDPKCNFVSSAVVYVNPKTKVVYDVLMSKVNVASGFYGRYSFYKMQVLHQKGKDFYILFTRWGRIGDRGEYQHTPFPTPEEAAKEFSKIFKAKSGNDWNDVNSFTNQPKKYRLIHREAKKKVQKIHINLTSDLPSKLSPQVLDLMKEMCDTNMMDRATRILHLDPDVMPFGQIKRNILLEARKILQQIGELISIVEKQERNILAEVQTELQSNIEMICTLTNEYYHLIPMSGYSYEQIKPIDDKATLKRHLRQLSDLLDLEVASKMVLGAQHRIKEINPYDYLYKSLNCKIEPLAEDAIETQYLLGYIRASSPEVKPHSIYKLCRPGEEETMGAKNLSNHRLLFHGSNIGNFISILNRGLLVAPVDVPVTGHLFGEGIYSSDCFAKSQGYSSNCSVTSDINLMLVCEVALGNCKTAMGLDQDDLMDPEYNSLQILGRQEPDPIFNVDLPYGATIPLGNVSPVKEERERSRCMPYNEFIIHDSSQLCLRYLIMYKPF